MKSEKVGLKRLGSHIELRILGWGDTGKGDRCTLLSAKNARKLAYRLLAESEDLDAVRENAA
jgi:hypothetical protein